jgi:hypothetical protein
MASSRWTVAKTEAAVHCGEQVEQLVGAVRPQNIARRSEFIA